MRRSLSPNIDVDTGSLLNQLTKYIKEVVADKEAKTEGNYKKSDRTKTNLDLTQAPELPESFKIPGSRKRGRQIKNIMKSELHSASSVGVPKLVITLLDY